MCLNKYTLSVAIGFSIFSMSAMDSLEPAVCQKIYQLWNKGQYQLVEEEMNAAFNDATLKLHAAVEYALPNIVKRALQEGAEVNSLRQGLTPLSIAMISAKSIKPHSDCEIRQLEVLKILLTTSGIDKRHETVRNRLEVVSKEIRELVKTDPQWWQDTNE